MDELVEPTSAGRSFEGAAVVRLGDSSPGGRARLDALARVVQDVSDDDARAAGFGDFTWVVRRTHLVVHRFPAYLEPLELRTWCAGFGAAWAERRVSIRGERGGHVESATLWVHLDPTSMRPSRLPREFLDVFTPSALGRAVSARATLPPAPSGEGLPWPVRFADFDVLEHVNNAVYLAPVEEELARRRNVRAPLSLLLEHGDPIERDQRVVWVSRDRADGGFDGWLVAEGHPERQFAAVSVGPAG